MFHLDRIVSRVARATCAGLVSMAYCAASFSVMPAYALSDSSTEKLLFFSDWTHGIDARLQYQRASADAIQIVALRDVPSGKGLRFSIQRSADYTGVANGTPRAEISFGGFLHFARGHEYIVEWQMRIPEDYQFDSQQEEVIGQIHQGPAAGYPAFALFISGDGQYEVHSRTEFKRDYVSQLFGTPLLDRGRLVKWKLVYVPDPSGRLARTELFKDGEMVFSLAGVPNAYAADDSAYFKLGIYKAQWKRKPSDVAVRTMEYGSISILERTIPNVSITSTAATASHLVQINKYQEVTK
ncbi:heparin lyase I family protein [Caballeronia sp. NK8]|uniref:heparin lyase I family protein n=1 Tax=Caballeronia sp. NK8 TaxID=140098 RepID=UPI001BCCA513|nr:heparin lyase I family protein [Caballeronia sp. NK8]